jgi:UDP-GlcNAc:undecaprenyl-phosphate GlcNAc-1-phosphate transferase
MLSPWLAQLQTRVYTIDQVVPPYIYVFYVSFVVSFLLTPLMRVVATYYGVIDRPDNIRKMHTVPIAYLGGIAVFMGWLAGLAISQFLALHRMEVGWPTTYPVVKFSIVIGGLVIVVLGLWDDTMGVRPWVKISGQVGAALFLLWDNVGIEAAKPTLEMLARRLAQAPGMMDIMYGGALPGPGEPVVPGWLVTACSAVMVVGIIVVCCNASNLMDGLDGLCGGVTAIIAAAFLFVAVHLAMVGGGIYTNTDALRVILGLALLGAVLGFVPYNFNPASIFMGDTGSMLLGYSCGTMIILLAQHQPRWGLAAMVIFALPILDTALAFARRWIKGRPIFEADRGHFHHQLVARGFTVKQTVFISYALSILFAVLGISMVFMRTRYTVAVYLVIFAYVIVAAYKMGMVHERPRVVRRQELGAGSGVLAGESHAVIEPATVLEVREDERAGGVVSAPAALTGATPNSPVDPARENGGGNGVIPVSTRLTTRAEASESTAGSSVEVAPRA